MYHRARYFMDKMTIQSFCFMKSMEAFKKKYQLVITEKYLLTLSNAFVMTVIEGFLKFSFSQTSVVLKSVQVNFI